MELAAFTLWGEESPPDLKRERNENYSAPITLDQLLDTQFQLCLQLHFLLCCSSAITNLSIHPFLLQKRKKTFRKNKFTVRDHRVMLVIGFAFQIYNVNTPLNCEYKFDCTYN